MVWWIQVLTEGLGLCGQMRNMWNFSGLNLHRSSSNSVVFPWCYWIHQGVFEKSHQQAREEEQVYGHPEVACAKIWTFIWDAAKCLQVSIGCFCYSEDRRFNEYVSETPSSNNWVDWDILAFGMLELELQELTPVDDCDCKICFT